MTGLFCDAQSSTIRINMRERPYPRKGARTATRVIFMYGSCEKSYFASSPADANVDVDADVVLAPVR